MQVSSFFRSSKPGRGGGRSKARGRLNSVESGASKNSTTLKQKLAAVELEGNRGLQTLSLVAEIGLVISIFLALATRLLRYVVAAPSKRLQISASVKWRRMSQMLLRRAAESSSQHTAEEPVHEQDSASEEEEEEDKFAPMHVDIFGAAVSSLICDANCLALGRHCHRNSIRAFRVVASVVCCWAHMGLQTYLLYMVSTVVADLVVTEFRSTYDEYEVHMYGNTTHLNKNGFHRGEAAHFDPTRFATLDEEIQSTVCQMPLANDFFFLGVIFVWTLTCVVDVRKCFQMIHSFIVAMPSVNSIMHSVKLFPQDNGENEVVIVAVPVHFKAILVSLILLPRLMVDCATVWLGCKWLAATAEMGELLLNAVALEFVVLLNECILVALVPKHGLDGLERTKTLVGSSRLASAEAAVGATFMWVFLCLGWCLAYVYWLQNVVPEYNWDIRGVCDVWRQFHSSTDDA